MTSFPKRWFSKSWVLIHTQHLYAEKEEVSALSQMLHHARFFSTLKIEDKLHRTDCKWRHIESPYDTIQQCIYSSAFFFLIYLCGDCVFTLYLRLCWQMPENKYPLDYANRSWQCIVWWQIMTMFQHSLWVVNLSAVTLMTTYTCFGDHLTTIPLIHFCNRMSNLDNLNP